MIATRGWSVEIESNTNLQHHNIVLYTPITLLEN